MVGGGDGNPEQAIYDHLRLYVLWSFAYFVLFTLLQNAEGRLTIHAALVVSGYVIFLLNLIGFADFGFELGLLSDDFRKELDMYIGIHDGYIQVTSHNIAIRN